MTLDRTRLWLPLAILATSCTTTDTPPDCRDGKCDPPPGCTQDHLVSIARPDLMYRARYIPAAAGQPTIVFLPGGPGNTSIGDDMSAWIPDGYGIVQTDPRGVGCNELRTAAPDPLAFYGTTQIAGDVIAMLEYLQLDDFVLYGHSYGTELTTVIASRLAADPTLPQPRAVVLEGVLGRAFHGDELPGQAYADIWAQTLRPALPADALAILDGDAPLGIDGTLWGKYMMAMMPRGSTAQGNPLINDLLLLSDTFIAQNGIDPVQARMSIEASVRQFEKLEGVTPAGLRLQRHVACREITDKTPEDNVDVILDHGQLVPSPRRGSLCTGLTLDTPYDSAALHIPYATTYIVGELDPATPEFQSTYHFEHGTSPRTRVTVKAAGHLPLHFNLATDPEPCAKAVVAAIATGGDLGAALATCRRPSTVDRR